MITDIPRAESAPLWPDGRWRGEWYRFLQDLASRAGAELSAELSALADRVSAIENESDFIAQMIGTGSVRVTGSLVSGAVTFSLVNDENAPAASYYYGTDASGAKGWHDNHAFVMSRLSLRF